MKLLNRNHVEQSGVEDRCLGNRRGGRGEEACVTVQLALRYNQTPFGILRSLIYEGTSIFYVDSTQARESRKTRIDTDRHIRKRHGARSSLCRSYHPRCKQPACIKQNS